jgi:hypothetical protein
MKHFSLRAIAMIGWLLLEPRMSIAQTTSTGDCPAILSNVRAGRDINITIKCDTRTESNILDAVLARSWTKKDIVAYPEKWSFDVNGDGEQYVITPAPQDYFAQYNFTYTVVPRAGGSLEDTAFLSIGEISDPRAYGLSAAEFEKVAALREKYPTNILSQEIMYEIDGEESEIAGRGTKVGSFDVRAKIGLEGGGWSLQQGSVSVFSKDAKIDAVTDIFPFVNPDPDPQKREILFEFQCEADASMKVEIFTRLCKTLVEKTTLSETFKHAINTE